MRRYVKMKSFLIDLSYRSQNTFGVYKVPCGAFEPFKEYSETGYRNLLGIPSEPVGVSAGDPVLRQSVHASGF